jgi:hypothetical protein
VWAGKNAYKQQSHFRSERNLHTAKKLIEAFVLLQDYVIKEALLLLDVCKWDC